MSKPEYDFDGLIAFIQQNINRWPPLPVLARYYDDYAECYETLINIRTEDRWRTEIDGRVEYFDFRRIPEGARDLFKHWVISKISTGLKCRVVHAYLQRVVLWCSRYSINKLLLVIISGPDEIQHSWQSLVISTDIKKDTATAIKSLLSFISEKNLGAWHPSYMQRISALPTPKLDLYKRIKSGDCFISSKDQTSFVERIDATVKVLNNNSSKESLFEIQSYCMLVLCFQYGLRAGQIARISVSDVRCFDTGAVHISFPRTKQRKSHLRAMRRIKREWCPLFTSYLQTRKPSSDKLFHLKPNEVTRRIKDFTEDICGTPYTPGHFRHTASQRLVDAGASSVSVAEFLEHSTLNAGTVYYDTSANQAELINQALSISPIYSMIAEVARTKTITKRALGEAPSNTIVAGMPHGIPVSGIGKCTVGQPNCQKHPVFSCYNCRHFLALKDEEIHKRTLTDFRQVAREFYNAERISEVSPAFLQLKDTIAAVQRTLQDIQEMDREA